MIPRLSCLVAALGLAVAVLPPAAQAQPLPAPSRAAGAGGLQIGQLVRAEILPGWITPQGTRMAALHLRLAEGWKTYWRIPGEAGIAPRFDWSSSQNLAEVRVHWPQPTVFDQGGFQSIGYHDELILPLELVPARTGVPMVLDGRINIGVCDDICVPADLAVTAALRGPGSRDAQIERALASSARPARDAGIGAVRCSTEPARRGLALHLRATLPRQGANEHLVMELPGTGYWISDTRTWRDGADLLAEARIVAPRGQSVSFQRSDLNVTVLGGTRMLEHRGCTGE